MCPSCVRYGTIQCPQFRKKLLEASKIEDRLIGKVCNLMFNPTVRVSLTECLTFPSCCRLSFRDLSQTEAEV